MVLFSIFLVVLVLSFNFISKNLTSSFIRRITAVSFFSAGVLIINTLNIQLIGSGIGVYGGLFELSILSNIFSLFILIISGIILLVWPNISNTAKYLGLNQSIEKNLNLVQSHAHTETEEIQNSKEYYNNVSNQTKAREYSLIVLFNILGALLLITSSDLVSMYLSIELQSFGLYILASIYKDKRSSISAGLKYFLLGGLSSCIILLGSGLIYSYTGITKFDLIFVILNIYSKGSILDIQGISIGLILVFIGFMFKIAAAPFHNWSIDVYNDSPTLVTIWLTVMPKISILIFLLQILVGVGVNLNFIYSIELNNLPYASVNILSNLLLLSSLLSLILGAIVGLSQVKIKRLLAYSTVNHVGFLLLSLSVFTSSISNFNQSIESFIFYIIQYTLTNLNIFLIILALSYIINKNINIKLNLINSGSNATKAINTYAQSYIRSININISDMEYINSLKGLFYNNPILSLSLSLCLFSFAGVPPLVGFFAKQQVLYSSNSAGYFFLSLIAIIVSVISAFYYLKIIKIVFSMPSTPNTNSNNEIKESSELEIELNNNIITSPASAASASQLVSRNQVLLLSNSHSLLIGTLTVFLITFILNPELILNSMAIISSFNFKT